MTLHSAYYLSFGGPVFAEGGKPKNSEENSRSKNEETRKKVNPCMSLVLRNRTQASATGDKHFKDCDTSAPLIVF